MSELPTCIPPKLFSRNEFGLICSREINYLYKEDGSVDWRRIVPPQFIVPNRQRTKESDPSKLEDRDLLILLAGIKELASIRGYESVTYSLSAPTPELVMASCQIKWIPNFETEGRSIVSGGAGDATPYNTTGFGKQFLSPIAENRAFIRCVRTFLKVNVVGFEEINPQNPAGLQEDVGPESAPVDLKKLLSDAMDSKGVTFAGLKKRLQDENYNEVEKLQSISDLPEWKIFELTGRIKKING